VKLKDSILVGDNFSPAASPIYRSTVENNQQNAIVFKPSQSIDFEKYILYRLNGSGLFDSVAEHRNRLDTVFQDAVPTLHSNYTYRVVTKNFCQYYSDTQVYAPHRTIELRASPANDASYLEWTPYSGWNPLKYEILRLDQNGNYV